MFILQLKIFNIPQSIRSCTIWYIYQILYTLAPKYRNARSDVAATQRAILCGFYSRAATNRKRRLLNSVFSVKFFVIARALRKASFIRRITMQLDQPPLCYKAVYLHGTSNQFPRFLPMISHDDRPPRLINAVLLSFTHLILPFTCACATQILAAARIRER